MADGDIIHKSINKQFKYAYGLICEDHWEPEHIAYHVQRAIQKTLQEFGDAPVDFAGELIQNVRNHSDRAGKVLSSLELQDSINAIKKDPKFNCSPRGRDLMIEAAIKCLQEPRLQYPDSKNLNQAVLKKYVSMIHKKEFAERIYDTDQHHNNAEESRIQHVLSNIGPLVNLGIDHLSSQLTRSLSVKKLTCKRLYENYELDVESPAW